MKAVITAADPRHRNLPFQTITDRDGRTVPLIGLHLEELATAGVETVGIVHHAADANRYAELAESFRVKVDLIPQSEPRGFGHAVRQAEPFVGKDAFVLLVCDHVFLSTAPGVNCIQQLIKEYYESKTPICAVQETHESQVTRFGVVGADPIPQRPGLFTVKEVREKPTPTEAELHLRVPGHRAGYYLGFFGIHILDTTVFPLLREMEAAGGAYGLSPALNALARAGKLLASHINGRRYDLESDYGILHAQLALALSGSKRESVLSDLVKILAESKA